MTRYIFFTTSDLTTGWPGKDRRESEEPIAHLPLDRDGSGRPLWTTGRLEAAIEAGLVPVVLSSRARLFEHDAWWQSLVDEGHTHLMSSRGLSSMLPEDLMGLPKTDGPVTRYIPQSWMVPLCEEGAYGVLVLDDREFTAFCVDVLGSQYGLDWPTEDYGDGAEPMSWTGALKFLNQLLRPDG